MKNSKRRMAQRSKRMKPSIYLSHAGPPQDLPAEFRMALGEGSEILASRIAHRLSQRLARAHPAVATQLFTARPLWAFDAAREPSFSFREETQGAALVQRAQRTGEVWLIYSGSHFDATGGAQRPAQMARELVRQAGVGYSHWRQPEEHRGDLFLCRPAVLQGFLGSLGVPRRVLLVTLPDESGLALARKGQQEHWTVIYDCLDFWREFDAEWYRVEREAAVVELADLVLVSARKLEQWVELLGARRILYLPNAASPACWKTVPERPRDLHHGSLILLYSGWLGGSWFAWDLLREVAQYGETRNWQIHLIGEPTTPHLQQGNVHFLGGKSYSELGAYLHYSDVCLIPFVTNLLTECVSPLKAFDYVAAGKRVVSTPLPELDGWPGCWQAGNSSEFCRAIEAAAAASVDTAALARFRAEQTFARRTATLRASVFGLPTDLGTLPPPS